MEDPAPPIPSDTETMTTQGAGWSQPSAGHICLLTKLFPSLSFLLLYKGSSNSLPKGLLRPLDTQDNAGRR